MTRLTFRIQVFHALRKAGLTWAQQAASQYIIYTFVLLLELYCFAILPGRNIFQSLDVIEGVRCTFRSDLCLLTKYIRYHKNSYAMFAEIAFKAKLSCIGQS